MNTESEYLDFFSRVAEVPQRRFGAPLWARYPGATTSIRDSLGLFLEGYAFEREGGPAVAGFRAVAADVIAESSSPTLDPNNVWEQFRGKLGGGSGLNIKNNPLAPKGTSYTPKKGQTSKRSAIELANEVGTPLVQWVLCGLKENRTDEVHAKIREIQGVAEKIASLFLCDVARRYGVFPSTSRWLLQPIDTWVRESAAAFLGPTGDDAATARLIVEKAAAGGLVPEKINQGMWYFGAEIAESKYRLKQALANLGKAEKLLEQHQDSLSRGAGTESARGPHSRHLTFSSRTTVRPVTDTLTGPVQQ